MRVVILAGGGGTRLWPLSRQDFPKQFLHFGDGRSLLQKAFQHFLQTDRCEEMIISTNALYEALVREQLKKIAPEGSYHILIEPERKNTAPAIAYVAKWLQDVRRLDPSELVLILPSDHHIEPSEVFLHSLGCVESAAASGKIVTFGIVPTRPETGYGYIEMGSAYDPFTHHVKDFIEKPDQKRAQAFAKKRRYYWNSGIFAFSLNTFWTQLQLHAPELFALMQGSWEEVQNNFASAKDLSIDYALMEKTSEIVVYPLPVSWSDLGTWDSVYEALAKDENENVKMGNVLEIDTKKSLLLGGRRLISTIGLEDLLIVETEDATFISKKGESQRVKQLVQSLIQAGRKESSYSVAKREKWGSIKTLESVASHELSVISLLGHQTFSGSFEHPREIWISFGNQVQLSYRNSLLHLDGPVVLEESEDYSLFNEGVETAVLLRVSKQSHNGVVK